jgi:uncharacterized membrane protein
MTEIEGNTNAGAPVNTTTANILYAMHGLAPFTAWLLAVGAIIVGMATRDSVRGTYIESHFSWLSRTFWWGLLWIALLSVATFFMMLTIVLLPLAGLLWLALFVWYLYRVIRGWMLLANGKPAP